MNRTTLSTISGALFAFIIGLFIYVDSRPVTPYLLHPLDNVPTEEFYGVGDSMKPLLHSGDAINVQRIPYHKLRKGMAVVFMSGTGAQTCHVLIHEDKSGWTTRGINNPREDQSVMTPGGYIGVVVRGNNLTTAVQ